MSNLQYLIIIFILNDAFLSVTADIVAGQCPKVPGTKFSYNEIMEEFPKGFFGADIVIYGFLPSSPETKSLNIFAFNIRENIRISDYHIRLHQFTQGETLAVLGCTLYKPTRVDFENSDMEFMIKNMPNSSDKIDIFPRPNKLNKETCGPYLKKEFEYVYYIRPHKYLAIWGCYQINDSTYDRGLWVLGTNKNINNTVVENTRQTITEALADMKLEKQTKIWEKLVVNLNQFTPREEFVCATELAFNQCNKPNFVQSDNLSELFDEDNTKDIALFVCMCAILIVAIIVACIFIFLHKGH